LKNSILITDNNFIDFCAEHYENIQYVTREEFEEDIGRIKYIRKLLTRYQNGGDLKYRLILNHIVILSNIFSPRILSSILYFKFLDVFDCIKPFLEYLELLPRYINLGNEWIDTNSILSNRNIIEILKEI